MSYGFIGPDDGAATFEPVGRDDSRRVDAFFVSRTPPEEKVYFSADRGGNEIVEARLTQDEARRLANKLMDAAGVPDYPDAEKVAEISVQSAGTGTSDDVSQLRIEALRLALANGKSFTPEIVADAQIFERYLRSGA